MSRFIDRVVVNVTAGSGGHGCNSVHREKFKPLGGPDGGNGGHGGSVIFEVSNQVHTLLDLHFRSHIKAQNGKPGQGDNRTGANGENIICQVPSGTVVLDTAGKVLGDLTGVGEKFIAAQGGHGGLGNAALVSRSRKAPGFALLGELGESRELVLELKSVADVGLIGFPSAGKSSLISVVSAAKPKIGDYPFTTLTPNLGVVSIGGTSFTIADVPGLIPGAATGKGLGLDFLRHIERCAVLAHVVDCATYESGRDPVSDIEALEYELEQYHDSMQTDLGLSDLSSRPRIIILNKIDIPDAIEIIAIEKERLAAFGWPIFEISTLTRQGLEPLLYALAQIVTQYRTKNRPLASRPRIDLLQRNQRRDDSFTITRDPHQADSFIVTGTLPERWIRQTQFDNDEAVGFLADRLARLGVEAQLLAHGAGNGSQVTIGNITFDFDPSISTQIHHPHTARGTDIRLQENERSTAEERKLAREIRRTERHAQLGNHTHLCDIEPMKEVDNYTPLSPSENSSQLLRHDADVSDTSCISDASRSKDRA